MQLSLSCGSLIQIATVLCLYSACCHGSESLLVKTVKTIHLSKAPVKIPAPHVKPVGFRPVRTGANHGHHGNFNHNPHALPKTLPHVAPKTLPHVAPKTLPHVAPKTLPHVAPKTLPHVGPKTQPHALPKTMPSGPAKMPAVGNTDAHVKTHPQNDHGLGKHHDSGAQAVHTDAKMERKMGKTEVVNPDTYKMDTHHHSNGNGGHNNKNQPSPPIENSGAVANDDPKRQRPKGRSGQKGPDGKVINNNPAAPGTETKKTANPSDSNPAGSANNGQNSNVAKGKEKAGGNSQNAAPQPGSFSADNLKAFADFGNDNNNGNHVGNFHNSSVIQPVDSTESQLTVKNSGRQTGQNPQDQSHTNSDQGSNNDGGGNSDNSGNTGNGKGQKQGSGTGGVSFLNNFANNINNNNDHHNTNNYKAAAMSDKKVAT